ncbi:ketopantoate reductase family protein [Zavarzinia sp. CC-PAN008]|uniref:ketopantoate reductase family protein n=1 Tax=Zavarzinia sp. CC-PAN008 TaxID=3243332 RepID=UPI003F7428F4
MRIAVYGAGAVGGFFGARLAAAGQDVAVIARGPQLEAIRADGLRVTGALDLVGRPGIATDDPAQVGPVDLILLGIKLYDLQQVTTTLAPLIGPDTAVMTLQNGIDAPVLVAQALGPERVLAGVAYVNTVLGGPGHIVARAPVQAIEYAEYQDGDSDRGRAISAICAASGFDGRFDTRHLDVLWRKFCLLTAFSGTLALTRRDAGWIQQDGAAWATMVAAFDEALATAAAVGARLPADYRDGTLARLKAMPGGAKSSMLEDLEAGRRLEVDLLNGALVREADKHGVPVPVQRAILAALRPFAGGA